MPQYFKHFPEATHTNQVVKDITKRLDFRQTTLADPYAFLPYTIVGEDRPEDVAYYYYGDMKYTWLVYLSNNIIDPIYDWVLGDSDLDKFIQKKYASNANTTGSAVVTWTQNNNIHYQNIEDTSITITNDTYDLNTDLVVSEWSPITFYDYELQLNDDKRVIQLLDNRYAKLAETELKALLNESTS